MSARNRARPGRSVGVLASLCCVVAVSIAVSVGAVEQKPAPATVSLARVALVIGNAAYKGMPLDNPVNDAREMARTLKTLGFEVAELENAPQSAMVDAIRAFGEKLKATHGVGLFYFAGHGVQVHGHNYLIPTDSNMQHEDEVVYRAVDTEQVLQKMETAKNPLNIVVLDACRNNPFTRSLRGASSGLAPMEAPAGSIIAFATAPGAQAADGSGQHGVYTEQLLRYMTEPGLKAEDVFKRVRVAVRQQTAGQQSPWENTSLEGDFYFVAPDPGALHASVPAEESRRIELEFWQSVRAADKEPDYRAYLERYPEGQFAALARNRVGNQAATAGREGVNAHAANIDANRSNGRFSFSAAEERAAQENSPQQFPPAIPCAADPRGARIRIDIGEQHLHGHPGIPAGRVRDSLAQRLAVAGVVVADAGGAADYTLRGTITTQLGDNRYFAGRGRLVGEISMDGAFTLTRIAGGLVSNVIDHEESFVGSNPIPIYLDLVQLQADRVASRLYSDLCRANR